MFYYIKGNIEYLGDDYVIIDNNDIGYKISTSRTSIEELQEKKTGAKIYTELVLREDSALIYGFSTLHELELFQMLRSVTGIGAKVALGILSSIPMDELVNIISSGDAPGLMKAQGVGKKIAQRILLELKDKINIYSIPTGMPTPSKEQIGTTENTLKEAVQVLITLGYTESEARVAVGEIEGAQTDIEQIIKGALKYLAK